MKTFFFKQNYHPSQTYVFIHIHSHLLYSHAPYSSSEFKICTVISCWNTVYVIIVYIIVRYNNFQIWYTNINSEKIKMAWPSCISFMNKILQFVWTYVILTFPRHTAKKVPPLDTGSLTLL